MKNSLLVLVVFFVGCNLPYSNGVPENASVADELENVENCSMQQCSCCNVNQSQPVKCRCSSRKQNKLWIKADPLMTAIFQNSAGHQTEHF